MNAFLAAAAVILIWSIWGYVSSSAEQAEYSVLEKKADYEVRLYPSHIVAETTVRGPYRDALNRGFRIVAGYIFGGNAKKESIAMTAPVVEQKAGQLIAMTAPVIANIDGELHTIAFGMPREYTLETLPVPTDPRVKIVTIPERKMAIMRFSWFRTDDRVQSKKRELIAAIKRDNVEIKGEPQYAGYDAPWTPPWMTRNEVIVEIE